MKNPENGSVLVMGIIALLVLSVIIFSSLAQTNTELKSSRNLKSAKAAFYDAEAGMEYAINQLSSQLSAGTFTLAGDTISVDLGATPAGFSFELPDTLYRVSLLGDDYSFQVVGHGPDGATATVEALVGRTTFLKYGAFAEGLVSFNNSRRIYSYDSGTTSNPGTGDSTGEGDVGSNTEIDANNNTYFDGDIFLGESSGGTGASWDPHGNPGPTVTGEQMDVSRIALDPLGAVGGDLAATFTEVAGNNNNSAISAISGTILQVPRNSTVTLTAGNYYLSSISFRSNGRLRINTGSGDVNIYLTGSLSTRTNSRITLDGGRPQNFTVYSNSTSTIELKNNSSFEGSLYAPYASIIIDNSSSYYGMAWGDQIEIKNSGYFYFDTSLKSKFLLDELALFSWRQIFNQ